MCGVSSSRCILADKIYSSPRFLYWVTNLYAVSKYLLVSVSPILLKNSLSDVIIYSQAILLTVFICPFRLYFSLISSNSFS